MEIAMMLNGVKTIILTPKSEKWKRYSELIEEGEIYEIFKEHNNPNLLLKQKVREDKQVIESKDS
jgi:hypothetical protein